MGSQILPLCQKAFILGQTFWRRWITPLASEEDEARQERLTRIVLALIAGMQALFTLLVVTGWAFRFFPGWAAIVFLSIDAILLVNAWLVGRGDWHLGRFFPLAIFYCLGVFGSINSGLITTMLLAYTIAIILAFMLFGQRVQWLVLGLSLVTHLSIGFYFGNFSLADAVATSLTIAFCWIGIALLMNLLVGELQQTLAQARAYAVELQKYRDRLEDMVLQRTAALEAANNRLQREISARLKTEEELRKAGQMLEQQIKRRTNELVKINDALKAEINERKQVEHALRESEYKLRSLIEQSHDGIVLTDEQGRVLEWNQAQEQMTGIKTEDAVGKNIWDLQFKAAPPAARTTERYQELKANTLSFCKTGKSPWLHKLIEHEIVRTDGAPLISQESIFAIETENGFMVGSMMRDVTDQKRAERRLQYLATHDAMTGLPNRTLFNDRLKLALARFRRGEHQIAVMYIDLEGFKQVNDRFGHQKGDGLLQVVAQRLKACLRASDTVARLGGDEFGILVEPIHSGQDSITIAKKIQASLADPIPVADQNVVISGSIGISLSQPDADIESLLRRADAAMYCAKRLGKGKYHLFTEDTDF